MAAGFAAVAVLTGLPNDLASIWGGRVYQQPGWLPVIEFPWRVMFGTLVTFGVALCFAPRWMSWTPRSPQVEGRRDFLAKSC